MHILPAIDLRGGHVVRLSQGDYAQETVYSADPGEIAGAFLASGARWLHVVDLDGARDGEPQNLDAVRAICAHRGMHVEFGGGVRSLASIETMLALGVKRVILGTALVKDPALARDAFHAFPSEIVAGLDAREGKLATEGWREQGTDDVIEAGKRLSDLGAERFIVTDIATDGMLTGPNLALYASFAREVKGALIASGGVGSLEDLRALIALGHPPEGAIVGRALYEGKFTLEEALSLQGREVGTGKLAPLLNP